MIERRGFLKTVLAGCSLIAGSRLLSSCTFDKGDSAVDESLPSFATPDCMKGMPIKATFLDEVSWDIPHQNWGPREWNEDFKAMKVMGINTVVLIRAGLGKWISAPYRCLLDKEDVYYPPVDLVEMFLTLADKHGMAFYFGMYDSGKYWQEGLFQREIDLNMAMIDEVWKNTVIIALFKAGICRRKSAVEPRICRKFMPRLANMRKLFPAD